MEGEKRSVKTTYSKIAILSCENRSQEEIQIIEHLKSKYFKKDYVQHRTRNDCIQNISREITNNNTIKDFVDDSAIE
jgi:hypothetical protein